MLEPSDGGRLFAVSQVTTRLLGRIRADFPDPGSAEEIARLLGEATKSERIQAAIVLAAKGDMKLLRYGLDLAGVDWRDVLMNGGLENEDWPARLDAELGPTGPGGAGS